jgi:hypothetical protein
MRRTVSGALNSVSALRNEVEASAPKSMHRIPLAFTPPCGLAITWPSDAIGTLPDIAGLIGGLAALGLIWNGARQWYRRTLGRRRDRYSRLARLGPGAQLSFFTSVLGEPPAVRRTITKDDYVEYGYSQNEPVKTYTQRAFTECFYIDRDYYVQTISDADETVLAFSVTTRHPGFTPTFRVPKQLPLIERWRWERRFRVRYRALFKVRLARTHFSDLDPKHPDEFAGPHFRVGAGARSFSYAEFRSFGNPGLYQTYVFTASSASRRAAFGPIGDVIAEIDGEEWPGPDRDDQPLWEDMPATRRFRAATTVTTYTVIGPTVSAENFPSSFGPREDHVRTIP